MVPASDVVPKFFVASTYCSLPVHIVFATKDRRPLIDAEWRDDLFHYLGGTARKLEATTFGVGGTADHVHMLIGLKTTHSVADLMREIKKSSSIWALTKRADFAWQTGYGAFGIRASEIPVTLNYIHRQEEHHRTISSADELRKLLAEFEFVYNEEYFD